MQLVMEADSSEQAGRAPRLLDAGNTGHQQRIVLLVLSQRSGSWVRFEAPTSGDLSGPPAPPPCLTAREVEVLDCLAAGHSTAEIARLLWITPATVSKHLEHVYRKLGVRSRTAALAASKLVRSG
jgi:DNA-binding CsgD family transcriptional regulator